MTAVFRSALALSKGLTDIIQKKLSKNLSILRGTAHLTLVTLRRRAI